MRVFISYRRDDSRASTGRIYDSLSVKFSSEGVYKDVDNIPYGRDFRLEIDRAIDDSYAFVLVIGPNWLKVDGGKRRIDVENDHVRVEIRRALSSNVPVFPVLVDGAVMPAASDLPADIRDVVFLNSPSLDHDTWNRDMLPLLDALAEVRVGAGQEVADNSIAETVLVDTSPSFRRLLADLAQPIHFSHVTPYISDKKLGNARTYCRIPESESILLLIDGTNLGSAKRSICFCNHAIYFNNPRFAVSPGPGWISYAQLASHKAEFVDTSHDFLIDDANIWAGAPTHFVHLLDEVRRYWKERLKLPE